MKIAIIGAGAIGGYVGVKLALAGEDATVGPLGLLASSAPGDGREFIVRYCTTIDHCSLVKTGKVICLI